MGLLRAKTRVRQYSLKVVFVCFIAEEKQLRDNRDSVQIRVAMFDFSHPHVVDVPPYQLPLQIKEAPSDEVKSAYISTDEPCLFLHAGLIFLACPLPPPPTPANETLVTHFDDIRD